MSREARLRRARELCAEANLGALLVPPSPDLVYLTGYDPPALERATLLVVRTGADAVLVVPELERPLAEASSAAGLVDIVSWTDEMDPYAALVELAPGSGTVAVGDRLWASHLLALSRLVPGVTFVPSSRALPLLRAIKEPEELARLSAAARGADAALEDVVSGPFLGTREADVAAALAASLLAHGHESVAFTIVGSAQGAASPHHAPGERRIRDGDAVVMDFGGRVGGYCSDITRTVVAGEADRELARIHEIVLRAQEAGVRAVRPGAAASEVDRACREVIAESGYAERFVHRTGHGIGLEEHEPPWISAGNDEPLRSGMTFSVEPGIYLPGRFGVRIEDIVAVTDDGVQRLNEAPRVLRSVN
jgi:Xaa-Pro aminopeptidase